MASSASAALPTPRTYPVNRGEAENEFRAGMEEMLDAIERQIAPGAANPYAGAGDQVFHEHDTRVFFFDRLLKLLGWELGPGGNVAEEARIKADTTKFVDYVGINLETRAPALILEAKAWDKPLITGKGRWRNLPSSDLVVAAVKHINSKGEKAKSPVTGEWHDNLSQLARYVRMFKEEHGHEVPCAVLSSGEWILVFKMPATTFCGGGVNDQQFQLFERKSYVADAHSIFEAMARVALADTAPITIRSAQLGNYVSTNNFEAAYHAQLIHYERSGTELFAQLPRILVYPALIVERDDGALFTVIDVEIPIVMHLSRTEDDNETLGPHIHEVTMAAQVLVSKCATELGAAITPRKLADFPGFPETSVVNARSLALGRIQKILVRPLRTSSDNWIAVTGQFPHYLHETPVIHCRFHAWAECRAEHNSIGPNAIGSPSTTTPRAFFVDTKLHHCAHQAIADRRHDRCHIQPIDSRTCCKACAYQDECWSDVEAAALPCGN